MDKLVSPVYFDTNVFIYAIEGHEDYEPVLAEIFHQIFAEKLQVFTSEITLAECLIKPTKDKNDAAIQQYEDNIKTNSILTVAPVSRSVLRKSAYARNDLRLKLPDAIHVATAIEQNCKTFISNDKRLNTPEGMKHIYLKDLIDG